MECVKNPNINCEKIKQKYSGNHECCSQHGNEGRLGIFVRKGNCDKSRGLPVRGCKDPDNKFVPQKSSYENFTIVSREGYTDDKCDCSNLKYAFIVIFILISMFVFLAALWFLKKTKI